MLLKNGTGCQQSSRSEVEDLIRRRVKAASNKASWTIWLTSQVGSGCFAWILFYLELGIVQIWLISGLVAIAPGVIGLGSCIDTFIASSTSWETTGNSPARPLLQTALALPITWINLSRIQEVVSTSEVEVERFLAQNRQLSGVNQQTSLNPLAIVAVILILVALARRSR
jgi:hypothetical protein